MPPSFVTLFETIWLPNHEELCNTKPTCKRARPSVTIKWRTKQLFIESYSGSRQGMLQTWETKFSNKRPFGGNKRLYTPKEVKQFPKTLQRSNSVKDKDHRKSMLECTGNTSASWPLNRQRSFALSKTRILHSILHPYFLMITRSFYVHGSDGSGRFPLRDKRHYCLMRFCYIANFLS